MPNLTIRRSLAAPPERVWPLLADAARWPEWMPGVETSRVTSDRVEGTGRRQRLERAWGGRRGEVDLEITEWEPPRRIGWLHLGERLGGKQQGFARDIRTRVTLEPAGGGSEIAFEGSWEPVGLVGRMLGTTLVASRAEEMLRGAAENLERLARGD